MVPRFADLSPAEVSDLWNTVQVISNPLQKHYEGNALTLAIQDGVSAGQTVPHVHVHMLPRRPGDFHKNDEVYDELDKSDLNRAIKVDADEDRRPRTKEDMAQEALTLRTLFSTSLQIPS